MMTSVSLSRFEQFTASELCRLFERHTGFVFHATVPGQLAARFGIEKKDPNARPATYDMKHFRVIWAGMMELALERCKYQKNLTPPRPNFPSTIHAARGGTFPGSTVLPAKAGPSPETLATPPVGKKNDKSDDLLPHPERCFITVPYADKDEAKALGAKWDFAFRMWYVPDDKDRALFRWPDELMPRFMRQMKPTDGFIKPPAATDKSTSARAAPEKAHKAKRKAGKSAGRSVAGIRMVKEMDDRLKHILSSE